MTCDFWNRLKSLKLSRGPQLNSIRQGGRRTTKMAKIPRTWTTVQFACLSGQSFTCGESSLTWRGLRARIALESLNALLCHNVDGGSAGGARGGGVLLASCSCEEDGGHWLGVLRTPSRRAGGATAAGQARRGM